MGGWSQALIVITVIRSLCLRIERGLSVRSDLPCGFGLPFLRLQVSGSRTPRLETVLVCTESRNLEKRIAQGNSNLIALGVKKRPIWDPDSS